AAGAARVTQRVVESDVVGDVCLGLRVQDRGREKSEIAGRARNVERARERQWFTGVNRFSAREFLEIALDQVRDAQENFRSLRRWQARPLGKRLLGGGYGNLDIASIAVGDLRVGFASRRLDIIEKSATDRLDKLAINEISNLD